MTSGNVDLHAAKLLRFLNNCHNIGHMSYSKEFIADECGWEVASLFKYPQKWDRETGKLGEWCGVYGGTLISWLEGYFKVDYSVYSMGHSWGRGSGARESLAEINRLALRVKAEQSTMWLEAINSYQKNTINPQSSHMY
jgi:hypothetical protein